MMISNKVGSGIFLLSVFLMGIVIESSAQITLQDIGVVDTTKNAQTPLYKAQLKDSTDLNLNVEFQTSESFSQYGILGAIPFKNGMTQIGNFTINRNVETAAVIFLKTFVLPYRFDYPMGISPKTIDQQYALPPNSPQLKLKIGN
jgi:hypothetical protein